VAGRHEHWLCIWTWAAMNGLLLNGTTDTLLPILIVRDGTGPAAELPRCNCADPSGAPKPT
jgi:hypothetical protein